LEAKGSTVASDISTRSKLEIKIDMKVMDATMKFGAAYAAVRI
jgi:hypothetical protein